MKQLHSTEVRTIVDQAAELLTKLVVSSNVAGIAEGTIDGSLSPEEVPTFGSDPDTIRYILEHHELFERISENVIEAQKKL